MSVFVQLCWFVVVALSVLVADSVCLVLFASILTLFFIARCACFLCFCRYSSVVEYVIGNDEVMGAIPISGTIILS